eukprot:GDKJ01048593.1.p1 GENE.GDKJ01048593.1~~GDKJ01048593.1.p1  ORF type:complete len:198 (+),score=38.59 GDKJ01048593.1:2076-2669(+)
MDENFSPGTLCCRVFVIFFVERLTLQLRKPLENERRKREETREVGGDPLLVNVSLYAALLSKGNRKRDASSRCRVSLTTSNFSQPEEERGRQNLTRRADESFFFFFVPFSIRRAGDAEIFSDSLVVGSPLICFEKSQKKWKKDGKQNEADVEQTAHEDRQYQTIPRRNRPLKPVHKGENTRKFMLKKQIFRKQNMLI